MKIEREIAEIRTKNGHLSHTKCYAQDKNISQKIIPHP